MMCGVAARNAQCSVAINSVINKVRFVVWSESMDVDEERRTSFANFLNENI